MQCSFADNRQIFILGSLLNTLFKHLHVETVIHPLDAMTPSEHLLYLWIRHICSSCPEVSPQRLSMVTVRAPTWLLLHGSHSVVGLRPLLGTALPNFYLEFHGNDAFF